MPNGIAEPFDRLALSEIEVLRAGRIRRLLRIDTVPYIGVSL
jgi:hypothetical protein